MSNNMLQFQNKQFQDQINAINNEYQQKINQVFQNWKQKPIIIYDDDDVKQEYNKIEQKKIVRINVLEMEEIKVDEKQEKKPRNKQTQKVDSNSIDQKRASKIQRSQLIYNEDQVQLDNQRIPKKAIKCGNQPFFIYFSLRSKQFNKVQYKERLQICKREWAIMDVTEKQIYKLMFLEKKQIKSDKETIKESEASKHQSDSIQ